MSQEQKGHMSFPGGVFTRQCATVSAFSAAPPLEAICRDGRAAKWKLPGTTGPVLMEKSLTGSDFVI